MSPLDSQNGHPYVSPLGQTMPPSHLERLTLAPCCYYYFSARIAARPVMIGVGTGCVSESEVMTQQHLETEMASRMRTAPLWVMLPPAAATCDKSSHHFDDPSSPHGCFYGLRGVVGWSSW